MKAYPQFLGNTEADQVPVQAESAYPRTRGEHPSLLDLASYVMGLPPHARGTHQRTTPGSHTQRLTPGFAGN